MFRKIAILISMFFLCLGLDNCKSPVEPEEPEPIYEYRPEVRVIYTRVAEGSGPNYVTLSYLLTDPAEPDEGYKVSGEIRLYKIGESKYRGYLSNVFVQSPRPGEVSNLRHRVSIRDFTGVDIERSSIDIQGAYDLEIIKSEDPVQLWSIWVYFRMS